MRVLLASSNPGKAREASRILAERNIEVVVAPLWLGEVETGSTYLENARLKALATRRMTADAVLAEDSGIEVDVLGGLPGPRSARFAGPTATDATNNDKLLRLLRATGGGPWAARYRAVAVLSLSTGDEIVGEGTFEGSITDAPRGSGGFGYDPLFVPAGGRSGDVERTAAELSPEEKDALSHRGQALRALAAQL